MSFKIRITAVGVTSALFCPSVSYASDTIGAIGGILTIGVISFLIVYTVVLIFLPFIILRIRREAIEQTDLLREQGEVLDAISENFDSLPSDIAIHMGKMQVFMAKAKGAKKKPSTSKAT